MKINDTQINTLQELEDFILNYPENVKEYFRNEFNGIPQTIDSIELEIINRTIRDIDFGRQLLFEFLKDNRATPQSFTTSVNLALLQKFSSTKAFAEVGDIKTCKTLLENTEIDSIFTQSRKDKYIQMCTDYLNTNA